MYTEFYKENKVSQIYSKIHHKKQMDYKSMNLMYLYGGQKQPNKLKNLLENNTVNI